MEHDSRGVRNRSANLKSVRQKQRQMAQLKLAATDARHLLADEASQRR